MKEDPRKIRETLELVLNCIKAQIKEPDAEKRIAMGKKTEKKINDLKLS
jgi:hypothetical protein